MTKEIALKNQFEKATHNLRDVLDRTGKANPLDRAVFRDSAIQRFEIAFDICWKMLKEILRNDHGIECASPKKCFQEAFKQGIIEQDEMWIKMTDMRNETSHAYNEAFAEMVFGQLPEVIAAFEKLLWKLKK